MGKVLVAIYSSGPANPEAMSSCGERAKSSVKMSGGVRADAIAFGSPTRLGSIAAKLKAYIDSPDDLRFEGKLNGKAGSTFTATSTTHGGNETTIPSLYTPMARLGLMIVPVDYGDPALIGPERRTAHRSSHVARGRRVPEVAGALALGTDIEGSVEGTKP